MTNGTITKKILAACKKHTDDPAYSTVFADAAFRDKVAGLLASFPLSSHKLVYDRDEEKVEPEVWAVLLEECVKSDERKMASSNRWMLDMGCTDDMMTKTFGRSSN